MDTTRLQLASTKMLNVKPATLARNGNGFATSVSASTRSMGALSGSGTAVPLLKSSATRSWSVSTPVLTPSSAAYPRCQMTAPSRMVLGSLTDALPDA